MNRYFLYIAAVATFLMVACTKNSEELVIPVTGVTLDPPAASLLIGRTLTLDAAVEPAEATNKTVTWSTDDDQIVTVNSEGELTAVAPGTTTITTTTVDGKFTATCTVSVVEEVIPVTGVSLDPPAASLLVGRMLTLDAAIEPAEATNKTVTWSTDDDQIVTVNSTGELTAVAPGTATITATTVDGKFTATCTVTVVEEAISVTGVILDPPAATLLVGETMTLDAAVEPAEATNKTVTWSTDDDQVATINSTGELTAVAPGTATITATTVDGKFTATCTVTVAGTGVITMTTMASYVWFTMSIPFETDDFIIDWGNGYTSNINDAKSVLPNGQRMFDRHYSSESTFPLNITIFGSNIVSLSCSNQQLTYLDVSRYTALTYLSCDNNKITSLDVSSNSALTYLSCSYNKLTSLNVSGNPELTNLDCRCNQLKTLDVSNNTALTDLVCFGNQLKILDVRNNTALTNLACNGNLLTALDVSKNTALTNLTCNGNLLTTLDVSNNIKIRNLECAGNQLTNLNANGNSELNDLDCSYNLFTTSALNDLFRTLPDKSDTSAKNNYIYISGNPGASECDHSIAEEKGWRVVF